MTEGARHGLLVALVVALVVALLLLFAAFTVAPFLVTVLCMMTYVVWWYISREGTSFMHHAQVKYGENCITTMFCVWVCLCVCIFS
ncbi:unnamed protein product [Choristocarpus tenellus]